MAENRSTFVAELRDETSAPAGAAARSLEQLRAKIEQDSKALRGASAGLARMKAAGLQNSKAADLLRAKIVAQKKAIGAAQESYISLGGTFGDVAKRGGGLGARLGAVFESLTSMVPVIGAVIGAFIALGVAVIAAGTALARYALGVADARRSEQLHMEGMLRMRRAYGIATASGMEVSSAIDRVADSSGLARSELSSYASMIARTGVRGAQLNEILEVTAIASSAAGDEAARSFASQASAAARAGYSITALGNRWRARFGDVARAQGLSIGRQLTRLRENISQLFGGIKLDSFLASLHRVLGLFSQTQATGRALRTVLSTMFNGALGGADQWATFMRDAIRRGVVGVLRLTLVFMRLRQHLGTWGALRAMLGDALGGAFESIKARISRIDWNALGARIGGAIARGIGGAIRSGITSTVTDLWGSGASTVAAAAAQTAAVERGRATTAGIARGMLEGRSELFRAARAQAATLVSASQQALQIHSPSRVFARLGRQIPAGIEQGIEQGSGDANRAAASVVTPSSAGATRPGSSRISVSIGQVVVRAEPTNSPRELATSVRDELASILEGLGLQMGAPA